ncbi:hypothetical protein NT239_01875 [Chitinibacter sp. SCUT-21]|uniref:hypothetical protein n=1 Tax=Chitinibacter sp. SCUT-21 TaxID=2970891 RepID=UPI0035A5EE7E
MYREIYEALFARKKSNVASSKTDGNRYAEYDGFNEALMKGDLESIYDRLAVTTNLKESLKQLTWAVEYSSREEYREHAHLVFIPFQIILRGEARPKVKLDVALFRETMIRSFKIPSDMMVDVLDHVVPFEGLDTMDYVAAREFLDRGLVFGINEASKTAFYPGLEEFVTVKDDAGMDAHICLGAVPVLISSSSGSSFAKCKIISEVVPQALADVVRFAYTDKLTECEVNVGQNVGFVFLNAMLSGMTVRSHIVHARHKFPDVTKVYFKQEENDLAFLNTWSLYFATDDGEVRQKMELELRSEMEEIELDYICKHLTSNALIYKFTGKSH